MQPENQKPEQDQSISTQAESDSQLPENNDTQDSSDDSSRWKRLRRTIFNPYLLGLIALIVIGAAVAYYVWVEDSSTVDIDGSDVESSEISQEDFAELAAEQAEIDSTNKTLNVTANSVFNGTMQVESSLDVQGQLRVGGELNLNDLSVAGQSTTNNLDVANDLNVQGGAEFDGPTTMQSDLTVSGGLTVASGATFGGNLAAESIEAGSLSFNGNLEMNGHIITSGPQASVGSGGAVGAGGTVSVSGNDISGTVNVNTGTGTSSGNMATLQFGNAYSQTPKINITPVGAGAGSIDWYITRNADSFSIRTASAPPASSNFSFDYFVVQ